MARKYFLLLAPLFVLLWVAGTNHCALEYFFSVNAATAQGDCESHSDKSADSHKEGQPCAAKSIVAGGEQLQVKTKIAVSDLAQIHLVFAALLNFGTEQDFKVPRDFNDLLFDPFTQRLSSLSIASNAPPVTA